MMGKLLVFILERCPWLEVIVRRFLWKFPMVKRWIQDRHANRSRGSREKTNPDLWKKVRKQILDYPIHKGDILLVHSSMDGLAQSGVSPKEVLDFLLELVGQEGTLVFAAYPKCGAYQGKDEILYYHPKKTLAWTGMLPNVFCRYPDVIRSEFPYNSLAAKGRYAKEMMKDNLLDDTSQAGHSAWQFCIDHHAKILYLGVSAALSCTMMNYPEDALGSEWYVKDWYHTQKYAIQHADQVIFKETRERDPDWYRFYTMFYSEYWMVKHGFLVKNEPDGIYVGFTPDMHDLAKELLHQARQGRSVYRIPRKYWK